MIKDDEHEIWLGFRRNEPSELSLEYVMEYLGISYRLGKGSFLVVYISAEDATVLTLQYGDLYDYLYDVVGETIKDNAQYYSGSWEDYDYV